MSVFEVPSDHYMLLGDNRKASTDSRSCFASQVSSSCKSNPERAFVLKSDIRGKAWIVWWPLKNIRIIETPTYSENQETVSESLEEK